MSKVAHWLPLLTFIWAICICVCMCINMIKVKVKVNSYRVHQWELLVMVLQLRQSGRKVKKARETTNAAQLGNCWSFHFCQSSPFHLKLMHPKVKFWTSEAQRLIS